MKKGLLFTALAFSLSFASCVGSDDSKKDEPKNEAPKTFTANVDSVKVEKLKYRKPVKMEKLDGFNSGFDLKLKVAGVQKEVLIFDVYYPKSKDSTINKVSNVAKIEKLYKDLKISKSKGLQAELSTKDSTLLKLTKDSMEIYKRPNYADFTNS